MAPVWPPDVKVVLAAVVCSRVPVEVFSGLVRLICRRGARLSRSFILNARIDVIDTAEGASRIAELGRESRCRHDRS